LKLLTERELIDLDEPETSQLRTKPLAVVEHGGGPKFAIGSATDARWQAFLKDYALTVRQDGYVATDKLPSLPKNRSWLSELQIRITDLPADWNDRLIVVTLHPLRADGSTDQQIVARGDSLVNAKQHVWQNALTIYASEPDAVQGSATSAGSQIDVEVWNTPVAVGDAIRAGKYVLNVILVGSKPRTESLSATAKSAAGSESGVVDPKTGIGTLVGTFALKAPWPAGYQPPLILSWKQHR